MTDDASVYGEDAGYVPCFQVADAQPDLDLDGSAIAGESGGYVATVQSPAAPPDADEDGSSVAGVSTGFVAKPCFTTVLFTDNRTHADAQAQSRVIDRQMTDTGGSVATFDNTITGGWGAGIRVLETNTGPRPSLPIVQEEFLSRTFMHCVYNHTGGPPTLARLRTRVLAYHGGASTAPDLSHQQALPPGTLAPTYSLPYEILLGSWGEATPVYADGDGGTIVHAGSILLHPAPYADGAAYVEFEDVEVIVPVSLGVTDYYVNFVIRVLPTFTQVETDTVNSGAIHVFTVDDRYPSLDDQRTADNELLFVPPGETNYVALGALASSNIGYALDWLT